MEIVVRLHGESWAKALCISKPCRNQADKVACATPVNQLSAEEKNVFQLYITPNSTVLCPVEIPRICFLRITRYDDGELFWARPPSWTPTRREDDDWAEDVEQPNLKTNVQCPRCGAINLEGTVRCFGFACGLSLIHI